MTPTTASTVAPTIAIVGRPNVGKSTLFNRLVGRRSALVDDRPGVTRDWREGEGSLGPARFRVIDTAGLEDAGGDSLEARMQGQTDAALDEADLVLMVVDGRAGLTPLDRYFGDWLRRRDRPVCLVVNKAEGMAGEAGIVEAYELGLGEPVAISAQHGEGLSELYDAVVEALPAALADDDDADQNEAAIGPLKLAIIGRPNVGKSTLVNRLVGSERVLTGPEAGITRDAITVPWRWRGRDVELVDTAGMRKRARVAGALERMSVADSLRTIRSSHVVALVVDATRPMEKQDFTIASLVIDQGRALVIVANKWDLVEHKDIVARQIREQLEAALTQVRGVAVKPISAVAGNGIDKMMDAVFAARDVWQRRVPTAALNRWIEDVLAYHPPPLDKGRRVKIRYLTQVSSRPPTFALFVNRPNSLKESYRRYLANGLRNDFGLPGTPIRLVARGGKNPYVKG
jgi:GTP-binding protein